MPYEVAYFCWVLAHDGRLTRANLQKRGVHMCSRCFFCERDFEDSKHLLYTVKSLGNFDSYFSIFLGSNGSSQQEFLNSWLFYRGSKELKKIWRSIPGCVLLDYLERNQRYLKTKVSLSIC